MFGLGGTGEQYLRARLKTGDNDAAGTTTLLASSNPLTAGTWYHVALTYDGSNMILYRNGSNSGSTAKTGNLRQNTWDMKIGNNPGSNASYGCMDGKLDEVRISSVARSINWLTTEHNNQSNPSNFCGIGAEEEQSGWAPVWTPIGGIPAVTLQLPSGRYIQWRATLTTSDTSKKPTLQEVRIYHY